MAVCMAAILASGCSSMDLSKFSALDLSAPAAPETSIAAAPDQKIAPPSPTGVPKLTDLARANAASPHDSKIALGYARGLKKEGRLKEALAVLEAASSASAPPHRALIVERGLMSLELGQMAGAQKLLASVNDPKAKDWRVLSGLGVASASLGQQPEAQVYFQSALAASPNNATVLNNLAMSYMLDKKVDKAEQLLRRASKNAGTKPRVAKNLALAVSLKPARGDDAGSAKVANAPVANAPVANAHADTGPASPARESAAMPMGLIKTPAAALPAARKDGSQ
jgi:Flp pilus assembly protein TadD